MHRISWSILIALLFIPGIHADPLADAKEAQDDLDAVTDGTDPLTDLMDGLTGTAEDIGGGIGAAGDSLQAGVAAFAGAVATALRAIGGASVAVLATISLTGATVGVGTSSAALTTGSGIGSGLAWTGSAATGALLAVGTGVGSAVAGAAAWTGSALAAATGLYWSLIQPLRPAAVPPAIFAGAATTGAVASGGVAGWAGWELLRKWGVMGPLGIAGFSRINGDELLEHPVRSQLYETIQSTPGIHASQLARDADVGWGTATHHLTKLEKARLITTRKVNNQKCYFQNGGSVGRSEMELASAVKGDTAGAIADYVAHHPMTSQKELAEAMGISAALASFHVKKLTNLGVLEKVRHGKKMLLTTSDAMRRLIASEQDPAAAAALQDASATFSS